MKPIKLIKSIKPIHIIFIVVSILLVVFLIIGFANNWDFSSKHKSNTQPQMKNEMKSNNLKSSSVQNNDETTNALISAMDVLIKEIDDLNSKCK